MKKIILPIGLLLMVFAACNNQKDTKQQTVTTISKDEKDLLLQAQGLFKSLLGRAESTENTITAEKLKLGKLLYFDTRLSKTGNNSCNSCHNLATFGVDNLPTSKGDAGKFGERNSPTVLNAALNAMQFWDGRAKDVEEQAGGPILNPIEMAIPSKEFLVKKLKGITEYQDLFKAAYPSEKDPLTFLNIQKSIGAFERTMMTPSPFDTYLNGDYSALNAEQLSGLKTFINTGCISCHGGMLLGGSTFQKFGVFADYRTLTLSENNDEGRKKVTKSDADKDMFKVPSLRNIEKTSPYFHDGSIKDLKQALIIMGKLQLNKNLTDAQAGEIVLFLNSLTGTVSEDVKNPPTALAQ